MKSDESFEREVRASLRASAAGPAPDELLARIGAIPSREPSPRAGVRGLRSVARLAVNLAAAAVVVIAVAALIVSRNGGNLPAGGQPTGSGSVATPGAEAVATCVHHDSPEPRLELRGIAPIRASSSSGAGPAAEARSEARTSRSNDSSLFMAWISPRLRHRRPREGGAARNGGGT